MTRTTLIALGCLSPLFAASEVNDLLRFTNGDQLHGKFLGLNQGPGVNWQRDDLSGPVAFGIGKLRHMVLRNGVPASPLKAISLVELVNGDQIPGAVTALDDKQVTIDSPCAGVMTIERNKITRIAPQPMGGRLHYHGPFSAKRWDVIAHGAPENQPEQQADPEAVDKAVDKGGQPDWEHSGAAWYWHGRQAGTVLMLRDSMPRQNTLRFEMAWKGHLNLTIATNADLRSVKDAEPQAAQNQPAAANVPQIAARAQFIPHDTESLPRIFGNAMILQLQSSYLVVYRSVVDAQGNHSLQRIQTSSNRLRLGENSKCTFELRSDLETGSYSLFVDDEFITQWNDPAHSGAKPQPLEGGSLAFMPHIVNGKARISDIIIAEWNGMPDSARSLQVDDQDIILMTNGLDRLSGKALRLEKDDMLVFKGRHGEFKVPMQDITEIRLARKGLAESKSKAGQMMKVRFSPMGFITGTPLSGDAQTLLLRNPLVGEISLSTDSAVMLEFDDSHQIFTDWDENF